MESSEGLKRTIAWQGWKTNSLADQLGQKVPWEAGGLHGFHRPALIQAQSCPTKTELLSNQLSTTVPLLITFLTAASVNLHVV